ncbi:GTP-dependent dephospho-CoA kinase family protein [Cuniculiplasma sp. SKW3]|uniref:GTP-dependent dephospho-CoA kinase family protein n=1 Tax=Cuniculiplasma sp. SKW3 TaxID=3400170 RepID=UPI003FD47ADB
MQLRLDSDYLINDETKGLIQSNNGEIINPESLISSDSSKLFAVGDYTCKVLDDLGIIPKIRVYDLKTQRGKEVFRERSNSIKIRNDQGVVSSDLIEEIKKGIEGVSAVNIQVEGEEDLAVLPIIFYAPINSLVVYGIPGRGMAVIKVDQNSKKLVEKIFSRMDVKKHEL